MRRRKVRKAGKHPPYGDRQRQEDHDRHQIADAAQGHQRHARHIAKVIEKRAELVDHVAHLEPVHCNVGIAEIGVLAREQLQPGDIADPRRHKAQERRACHAHRGKAHRLPEGFLLLHLHQRDEHRRAKERRDDHHQHPHAAKAAPQPQRRQQQERQPRAPLFPPPESENQPQNQEGEDQVHGIVQAVGDDIIVHVVKGQHQHRRQIRRRLLHPQLMSHIQEARQNQREAGRLCKHARPVPRRHDFQADLVQDRRADDAQLGGINPVFRVYPRAVPVGKRGVEYFARVVAAHVMRAIERKKRDRQQVRRRDHQPRQRLHKPLFRFHLFSSKDHLIA